MGKNVFRKTFAMLLCIIMVISLLPAGTLAVEGDTDYVHTEAVADGGTYVLAYKNGNAYDVISADDGMLSVVSLKELNESTVGKSMLWAFEGGAIEAVNGSGNLTVSDGEVSLTSQHDTYWDYAYKGEYVDYTDWSDEISIITVNGDQISAFNGNFAAAEGKVLFYAIKGEEIKAETVSPRKSRAAGEADHYIAVASDRHDTPSAIASAMGGMPSNVDYVCLDGDMVDNGSYNTSTLQNEVRSGAGLSNATVHVVYASHDSSVNDDAGILQGRNSSGLMYTGYNSDGSVAYYAYCASYNSLTSSSSSDASAFKTWVDQNCGDKSIPIIVISHVPLHYQRNDNSGAVAWNKALNYAATGKETTSSGEEIIRNVIFLHGHNHTSENNTEYYIPVGSTMQIYNSSNSSYIYYTYTTAGYLRDNTSATLIAIDDSNITISKYQNGSVTSTYASTGAKTNFSNTYDTDATHTIERVNAVPTLKVSVEQTEISGSPGETKTITPTVTYGGTVVTPLSVTYASSDDAVATVSAAGVVSFEAIGTAVITVTAEYAPDRDDVVTATATVNVTVKVPGSTTDKTVYVLTNILTAGEDYLIVSRNDAGTGYSLYYTLNTSGTTATVGAASVTVKAGDNDTNNQPYIEESDVEETGIWTAGTGSSSNYWTFSNNSWNLRRSNNNGLTITKETSRRDWTWDGNNNRLSNNSRYLRYNNNSFSLSTQTNSVYLYVKTVIETCDHDWEFTGFTWTGNDTTGYTAATANYKCKNDPTHTETKAATLNSEYIGPSCTVAGHTDYSAVISADASLDGEYHDESKSVEAAAAGWHTANALSDDTFIITFIADNREYAMYLSGSYVMYTDVTDTGVDSLGEEYKWTATYGTNNNISGYRLQSVSNTSMYMYYQTYSNQVVVGTTTDGASRYRWSYSSDNNNLIYERGSSGGSYYYVAGTRSNYNYPILSETGTDAVTVTLYTYQAGTGSVAPLGHNMTMTSASEPTCLTGGNSAYWYCDRCEKYFSDESGESEIETGSWIINALGHDWDYENIVWNWDGFECETATLTCKRDTSHTLDVEATVTGPENYIYTATITGPDGNTYTDIVEDVPVHTHDGIVFTAWNSATSLPNSAGSYYLTADVTIDSAWWSPNGVTNLCLNGHEITTDNNSLSMLIRISGSGTLNVYDDEGSGKITGLNTCQAFYVNSNQTINMYGGTITGNANSDVIYVYGSGVFNMYGGSITSNNTGTSYPVIKLANNGTFQMYGGSITGNTCPAVINTPNSGNIVLNGGSITNNTGAGIVASGCTVSVSGNPVVDNNLSDVNKMNIVLTGTEKITVAGELTSDASIGMYYDGAVTCAAPYIFTNGLSGNGTVTSFTSDQGYTISLAGDGEAQLVGGHEWNTENVTWIWADDNSSATATFVCSNDASHTESVTDDAPVSEELPDGKTKYTATVTFEGITYTDSVTLHYHDGIVFKNWTATDSLPEEPGNYYLVNNVTLSETWTVPTGEVNLCLNGHDITWSSVLYGINIGSSATLGLYDCAEEDGGKITGGTLGIRVQGGIFNMYGGRIEGLTSGVNVESNSVFNMYGGSITENDGVGVLVSGSGVFTMTGGSITDNGMGVISETFHISGSPVISGNGGDGGTPLNACFSSGGVIIVDGELTSAASIGVFITGEPTCAAPIVFTSGLNGNGSTENFISDQGYVISLTADGEAQAVLAHTLTKHSAVAATCVDAGNSAYWSCSECGKYFGDAEGMNEIAENSWVLPATGHTYSVPSYEWTQTDDGYDCTATAICSVCEDGIDGHELTETKSGVYAEVTAPTCTAVGTGRYTATFTNNVFTTQIKDVDIPVLPHALIPHPAVDATCTTDGNSAYWECDVCGKFFSDENGTTEIQKNSWVIGATGHSYEGPEWIWTGDDDAGYTSATATFTCSKCDDVQTPDVTFTVTDGEGSDVGKDIYTATVTLEGEQYTDVKKVTKKLTVTFNMMGHGEQIPSQTVTYGDTATKPDNPSAEGWVFDWYYTDEAFTTEFSFNWQIKQDTVLYVKWTEKPTATITFADTETTYNGEGQRPTVTVKAAGNTYNWSYPWAFRVKYYSDVECTEDGFLGYDPQYQNQSGVPSDGPFFRPVNAGTYYVKVEVGGTNTYYGNSAVVEFTIAKRSLVIIPTGGELTYNGWYQGLTTFTEGGDGVAEGEWVFSYGTYETFIDVGTYESQLVKISIITNGTEHTTDNYDITYETATLKINPATLTITTESANKTYDGSPLTAEGSIEGLVTPRFGPNANKQETVTFTVTGSQTEIGQSANTYSITWNGTAKESNYTISENIGTLTVTEPEGYTVTLDSYVPTEGNNAVTIEDIVSGNKYVGEVTFTVKSKQACVVAIAHTAEDGKITYEKVTAEGTTAGERSFTINVTEDTTIFIAFLGDVTLNGAIDRRDDNYIAKCINHWDGYEFDAKQFLVADIDGDGQVNRKDDNKLAKQINHWDDVKEIFEW